METQYEILFLASKPHNQLLVTARLRPRKERSYKVNALRTAPPSALSPTVHQFWCTPRISCCPGLNPLSGTGQGCSSYQPCNGCFLRQRRLCRRQHVLQSPLRRRPSLACVTRAAYQCINCFCTELQSHPPRRLVFGVFFH